MRILLLLLVLTTACQIGHDVPAIPFEQTKWQTKDGKDFPYRPQMVDELLHSDTIRYLDRNQVLDVLGEPDIDRDNDDYLYYMISQRRLASWPLHTRVLVIKMQGDTVEWVKIHE